MLLRNAALNLYQLSTSGSQKVFGFFCLDVFLCWTCFVDSFGETSESREGPSQCHPVESPTHDPRQEVPPQNIPVHIAVICPAL